MALERNSGAASCTDCGISFPDDEAAHTHLAEVHPERYAWVARTVQGAELIPSNRAMRRDLQRAQKRGHVQRLD